MLMLVEILVHFRILHSKIRAQIDSFDPSLQQLRCKLECMTIQNRKKGEFDIQGMQRSYVGLDEFEPRQRRVITNPGEYFGCLLTGVLSRSETAKLDQRMFGKTLHKLFTRITARPKNRDFRFVHKMFPDSSLV